MDEWFLLILESGLCVGHLVASASTFQVLSHIVKVDVYLLVDAHRPFYFLLWVVSCVGCLTSNQFVNLSVWNHSHVAPPLSCLLSTEVCS